MLKIKNIKSIEILDSRGLPTLRTFITLSDGSVGSASIPSGASTGSHEALELRDNDKSRFFGKGILKAIENIEKIITPAIINKEANSEKIDEILIDLDETENKSRLGSNAILSLSQALIKAIACSEKKPVWQILNQVYFSKITPDFPQLMLNVINGGKHANWNFDIQEFIIIPNKRAPSKAVRIGSEIYQSIKKLLKEKDLSPLVGDEGGFSPELNSNEEVFQLIINAAKNINYQNGQDFFLAIDAAASEFSPEPGKYFLKKEGKTLTRDQMIDYYLTLKNKYHIISFEDPLAENDWQGFKKITEKSKAIIIGDDIYTTDPKLIKKAIIKKISNAVLIKPNQIGTIKETAESINLAKKANWKIAISHRSGETEDSFIADLAYSCAADYIKTGAPCRSERLAKYNRLIEIENKL